MNDLRAFYHKASEPYSSPLPWLAVQQQAAREQLAQRGFPTQKEEAWRYVPLQGFLEAPFYAPSEGAMAKPDMPVFPYAEYTVVCADGRIYLNDALQARCPAGLLIQPLSALLQHNPERIAPYLNQILKPQHAFHALNTAMLQEGVVIIVPEGMVLDVPVVIRHWNSQADTATCYRHMILAETGSALTVVEAYHSPHACRIHTNTVTEIHLADHAACTHYTLQVEGDAAVHISQRSVTLGAHAAYYQHLLNTGGQTGKVDTACTFTAPHGQCHLNGIYYAQQNTRLAMDVAIAHAVAGCESRLHYRGLVDDTAEAAFQSRVCVAAHAMGTQASQQNKNLLLSPRAAAYTKPQFEIFADDVICAHGATVGFMEEEALFYLQSRGLDVHAARRWLERAFVHDNLMAIPDRALQTWIAASLSGEFYGSDAIL